MPKTVEFLEEGEKGESEFDPSFIPWQWTLFYYWDDRGRYVCYRPNSVKTFYAAYGKWLEGKFSMTVAQPRL